MIGDLSVTREHDGVAGLRRDEVEGAADPTRRSFGTSILMRQVTMSSMELFEFKVEFDVADISHAQTWRSSARICITKRREVG